MGTRRINFDLSALFYPSPAVEGRWVAHCLDLDLVATGDSPEDAFGELLGTLETYLKTLIDLGDKAAPPRKAPREFWEAAGRATKLPDLPIGELVGWAEQYAKKRKERLSGRRPARCKAAILTEPCKFAAVGS